MTSRRRIYLCVSCDADPDANPRTSSAPPDAWNANWQGVASGIAALRERFCESPFTASYGPLPITWLLRADRQIHQVYGDPAFCFKRFEPIWDAELRLGGEIGWHPHLYRWDDREGRWVEYLGQDDDLEVVSNSLAALRQCARILAVRIGWAYHSNGLMRLLARERLSVDASAVSGTVQSGTWYFDWRGAPRTPYLPSRQDYRMPAATPDDALGILEMPSLVRRLGPALHGARYCLRRLRTLRNRGPDLTDWVSSGYQGVLLTAGSTAFAQAVQESVNGAPHAAFVSTYFHADDLLSPTLRGRLVANVEQIGRLAERLGHTLVPSTLSAAADCARRQLRAS